MKNYSPRRTLARLRLTVSTCATVLVLPVAGRTDQTGTNASPPGAATQSKAATNSPAATSPRSSVSRKLSGAELYSMHCNRCHPERYPTERTAAQWKTILLQMRVRANLPAEQARTILKYLQDNSGR